MSMEKAKRKHRPDEPTWEFFTGYTLAESIERINRLDERYQQGQTAFERYRYRQGRATFDRYYSHVEAQNIERQDDGDYSFTLRRTFHPVWGGGSEESDVFIQELPDGTTRFYGNYETDGCVRFIRAAAIVLLIVFVPMLLIAPSSICLVGGMAFILMMAWAITGSDISDSKWTGKMLEETLTSKKNEAALIGSRPHPSDR